MSASCPRKNWPVKVVPSSQITFPLSCGCLSTVPPVYLTPFFNSRVWMVLSMVRGFLTRSPVLMLRSSFLGGLFLLFLGCYMMTDSPKLSPRERESFCTSFGCTFFLYSPFLIWERSRSSRCLGYSLKTSRILQSPMGVVHSGHWFPIIIRIFYYSAHTIDLCQG